MSATVSSSFIAMRRNVSRMSRAAATGSGIAVRSFRIDVDEAHLHCGERVLEVTVAAVALVAEPGFFGAPVGLVRLPGVLTAAGEAECLEAHRLQRAVAGEDHQVGPRDLAAVLLLDRPQQPACLVEVGVVGPAVERREALHAGAAAAAAVVDAVGAGAVPRHADEQGAIVAVVGRPPVLRRRHQLVDVLLQGIQVQGLELLRVVEVGTHRVGERRVLLKDLQVQLMGPPVAVRPSLRLMGKRALARAFHSLCSLFRRYSSVVQEWSSRVGVDPGVVCGA